MLYASLDEMENEFIRSPFYPGFVSPVGQDDLRRSMLYPIVTAAHNIFQSDALVTRVEYDP